MTISSKKAKIKWQCRRGMLELDLILNRFYKNSIDNLTENEISSFENLLGQQDPDLYAWLMGYEIPTEKELLEIVTYIRLHDKVK